METVVSFLQVLSLRTPKSIWYLHPSGKHGKGPHVHGLIYDYPTTDETLRNTIKKKFNLTDKKQYGLSNKYQKGKIMTDELVEPYIVYMSKGIHDPLCFNGYEQDYINLCKTKWIEPQTIHVGDLTIIAHGTVKKNEKKTQFQLSEDVATECMHLIKADQTVTAPDIIRITQRIMRMNQTLAHDRQVAWIAQAAMWNITGYEESRVAKILSYM